MGKSEFNQCNHDQTVLGCWNIFRTGVALILLLTVITVHEILLRTISSALCLSAEPCVLSWISSKKLFQ